MNFSKNKFILAMIFLIPLLVSLLLGYQFQGGRIKNIPTAIIDLDNSSLSRSIVSEIKANEIFAVKHYAGSYHQLQRLIHENKARVGVVIPEDFSKDLKEYKAPKVLVLYDGSQMAVTSAAKARMSEILLTLKTAFVIKTIEGKLNLPPAKALNRALPMSFEIRTVNNPTRNYGNFLIPGMIIALIQVGLAMAGVGLVDGDGNKSFPLLIKNLVYGFLGSLAVFLALGVLYLFFNIPYTGTLPGGILITYVYVTAVVALGIAVGTIIPSRLFATQVAAILVLPSSILGGYTWPLLAMPAGYQVFGNFLPFTHYAEVLRDLTLKNIGMEYVTGDLLWLVKFTFVMWGITVFVSILKRFFKSENTRKGGALLSKSNT
ncbi:MAG: type transport system permease protein [Clostridia bacterium]|nr:type transport system permease protein [Clostridia bacterium]